MIPGSVSPPLLLNHLSGKTGLLTPLSPATIAADQNPYAIRISSDGKFLYLPNDFDKTFQYSIDDSTGLLAALSPASVAGGLYPLFLAITPDDAHVYVVNSGDQTISQYSRNAVTGLLSALSPATIATPTFSAPIAVSPNGQQVYVGGTDIYQYDVGVGGLLSYTDTTASGFTSPFDLLVSPDGKFVYALYQASPHTVTWLSRDLMTGDLTATGMSVTLTAGAAFFAMSPDGSNLYVTDNDSLVYQYSVNTVSGGLTALSPSTVTAGGTAATGITVSPDGLSVYITLDVDNAVAQFSRNLITGLLTTLSPATVSAGSAPEAVAVSPDNNYVYVANNSDGTVSQYRRD